MLKHTLLTFILVDGSHLSHEHMKTQWTDHQQVSSVTKTKLTCSSASLLLHWMTCSFTVVCKCPSCCCKYSLRQPLSGSGRLVTRSKHMSRPQGALNTDCEYMRPIKCITVFPTHILYLSGPGYISWPILDLQLNAVPNKSNTYSSLLKSPMLTSYLALWKIKICQFQ